MKRLWSTRTIGFLALTLALAGCGDAAPVPLARYLEHVEIQAETDAQRTALAQAFDDMLRLRPEQLRAARYGPKRDPLPILLRDHLVPSEPVAVEDDEFYSQASDARVRAAVGTLRRKLPD